MATIASNPMFPGAVAGGAAASSGAAGTGAAGSAPFADNGAGPGDASGPFMQLVTGMIQGNTETQLLPSNLAAFLLTGEGAALQGFETDSMDSMDSTDTTDTDDEDGEASEALALAALLPGLQTFKPIPSATPPSTDGAGIGSVEHSSRHNAMQTLLDTSQAALTTAIEDSFADAMPAETAADHAAPVSPSNSASHAQTLLLAHKAAEAAPQAASAEVRAPVGTPAWSDEIGTHLTMMAANGREAASLRLSPEHLGPLEVRISMKDGEASVVFGAANADTRNALEQSLPRLREMFASQGLVLGDANVSREGPRDAFKPAAFAHATRGSSDGAEEAGVKPVTLSRVGLVDTYV